MGGTPRASLPVPHTLPAAYLLQGGARCHEGVRCHQLGLGLTAQTEEVGRCRQLHDASEVRLGAVSGRSQALRSQFWSRLSKCCGKSCHLSQISDSSQNLLSCHPQLTEVLMGRVCRERDHHVRVQLWLEADLYILQCPAGRAGGEYESQSQQGREGHRQGTGGPPQHTHLVCTQKSLMSTPAADSMAPAPWVPSARTMWTTKPLAL